MWSPPRDTVLKSSEHLPWLAAPSAPALCLVSAPQCPCLFVESKCGCTPLLTPPGSSPPHAGAENARLSSREAQDFAPLMCNYKKKATLPHSTGNPTGRSPRLGTLLPGCLLPSGSVCGLLGKVFLPTCTGATGCCRVAFAGMR